MLLMSPFAVAQNPRYRQGSCSPTIRTCWFLYTNFGGCLFFCCWMTSKHVFFMFTFSPHQSSNLLMTLRSFCTFSGDWAKIVRSSTKARLLKDAMPSRPCEMFSFLPSFVSSLRSVFMKMMKSRGDRALPCATPVSKVSVAPSLLWSCNLTEELRYMVSSRSTSGIFACRMSAHRAL